MTPPLTPANCDLRDFPRMMIDIPRLRGSDFDATPDDSAWRAGFNLWLTAWHQVPAGSLSLDDASLAKAAGLGRDLRTWRKVKVPALRGWVECTDGRIYHPVVAEIALESWLEKLRQRIASGSGNAKRWGAEFDASGIEAEIAAAAEMLEAINPASKALAKARKGPRKPAPGAFPPGSDNDPTGTQKSSHRDAKEVPPGSQETGTGTGNSSEADASAKVDLFGDPDATAWQAAKLLLMDRGGLSESAAGKFFGKLLSQHGVRARDMLAPVADATTNGTQDPQGFLTRAAQMRGRRAGAQGDPTAAERVMRSNIQ